jgi:ABC-type proline/glycine betaine transport system permease subunit
VFAIFVTLGFGLEAVYFRLTEPIRQRVMQAQVATPAQRLRAILARFAYLVSVVAVFALGSIGAFLALDWPASVRALLLGICWRCSRCGSPSCSGGCCWRRGSSASGSFR